MNNSTLKQKLLERGRWVKNLSDHELGDLLRLAAERIPEDGESISGAEGQLLRIAQMFGYERVWVAPEPYDQTKWFAERKHPTEEGMVQVVLIDGLIAARPKTKKE